MQSFVVVVSLVLELAGGVKMIPHASTAEYSSKEPAEYSAVRRLSRIFGWCVDLTPSELLQLIQAGDSSPVMRAIGCLLKSSRAERMIRLMKIAGGGGGGGGDPSLKKKRIQLVLNSLINCKLPSF